MLDITGKPASFWRKIEEGLNLVGRESGREGRENCYWDTIYERRIHSIYYTQQKKINKCRTRKCNLDRIENKKKKSTKHVYFKAFMPKKIKHSLVILSICEALFYLYTINLKNYFWRNLLHKRQAQLCFWLCYSQFLLVYRITHC